MKPIADPWRVGPDAARTPSSGFIHRRAARQPIAFKPLNRTPCMNDPARYDAAYRATRYRVHAGNAAFDLRVDVASEPLAALMRRHGVATAAYLTACNPYSVRASEAANRAANEALRAALVAADAFVFYGEAIDPTGAWPTEPSFLALGIALATARELGVRFRQNALLFADDDAVPRLVWLPRAA
jgi:hypothetical protein